MQLLTKSIKGIKAPDQKIYDAALARLADQAKPPGSLGMLEETSSRLAAIAGTLDVRLDRKVVVTCAGDHGVCEEGVSLYPQEVTPQMVTNFVDGGAAINVLARHAGAEVKVADIGVAADFDPSLPIFHKKVRKGTANFTKGPAMSREEAAASVEAGISIVHELNAERPVHLLGTGDMGIGNTTPSAAVISLFSGLPPAEVTGRGTGLDDGGLRRKIAVIEKGLAVNRPDVSDPLDVLAKVGGLEIGALAGLVIGAAEAGVPVVCDGFIATAGALIACELAPAARKFLFASHNSREKGHRYMHRHLGLRPLLDLEFRLGEGTGAAVAMTLLQAATRVLAEIRTFSEAGVSTAD